MSINGTYTFIIVDDHPFIRDGIRNYITAHDSFACMGEFSDTRSVLNSDFSGKPDVIVLDLNLPGIDGEKSCALLKRKFPNCKIIAFTQYEGREKELNKLGFDGYIVKSETDSLIEAFICVIEGGKYFRNKHKAATATSSLPVDDDAFLKIRKLTPREIEIARYITQNFSNREIGEKIFISESTVETHRKHIKEKLKAKNKRELFEILKNSGLE